MVWNRVTNAANQRPPEGKEAALVPRRRIMGQAGTLETAL